MRLHGKMAGLAVVHGQVWLCFHFALCLFDFNSGRLISGSLKLGSP